MVRLITSPCTFTVDMTRILEALGKSLGFMDECTHQFDWLAYYHAIVERQIAHEEALMRRIVIILASRVYDLSDTSLADFVARIRALRERMWKLLSRTSLCEGRFKSLLASIPTPPTTALCGRLNASPLH